MQFFNLHTHKFTNNPTTLELVNQYPWEFDENIPHYSIGIHPWYIDENRLELDLKIIEEKAQQPECLALGECGLDKRIEIPLAVQIRVFEQQNALAEKYQKTLVVHLVAELINLVLVKNTAKKDPVRAVLAQVRPKIALQVANLGVNLVKNSQNPVKL
jgi:TatD DNase family protein